jgi:hypothetical protein
MSNDSGTGGRDTRCGGLDVCSPAVTATLEMLVVGPTRTLIR